MINLGLQIWNAILALVGATAAERYGRRPLWLTSAIGMLFAFSIITALSAVYAKEGSKIVGGAVIAMLFIFFGFYDIAFTPLSFAYPIEILPYRLRSRGMSVTLTTVFAAGVSPLVKFAITKAYRITNTFLTDAQSIPQPRRPRRSRMEVLLRLHRLPDLLRSNNLVPVPRDQG